MVFGVNEAGVPSVSKTVNIMTAPAAPAAAARTFSAAATSTSSGTNEVTAVEKAATPTLEAVPMPPGTQQD
jgi:hypothetical protein